MNLTLFVVNICNRMRRPDAGSFLELVFCVGYGACLRRRICRFGRGRTDNPWLGVVKQASISLQFHSFILSPILNPILIRWNMKSKLTIDIVPLNGIVTGVTRSRSGDIN